MFTFDELSFRYREYLFEGYSEVITDTKVGIVGRNGCGKTTLLRLLDEQIFPERGSVGVDGTTYMIDFDLRRYRAFTMDDLVALCRPLRSFDVSRADLLIESLLADDYRRIPIGELSKGLTKKAALLMGLMSTASVLLVDEPFESIDTESNEALIRLLRAQQRAMVIVSHDQDHLTRSVEAVYQVADRRLVRA